MDYLSKPRLYETFSTGLPLPKARWIPRPSTHALPPQSYLQNFDKPTTPLRDPDPSEDPSTLPAAWDPSSHTPHPHKEDSETNDTNWPSEPYVRTATLPPPSPRPNPGMSLRQ